MAVRSVCGGPEPVLRCMSLCSLTWLFHMPSVSRLDIICQTWILFFFLFMLCHTVHNTTACLYIGFVCFTLTSLPQDRLQLWPDRSKDRWWCMCQSSDPQQVPSNLSVRYPRAHGKVTDSITWFTTGPPHVAGGQMSRPTACSAVRRVETAWIETRLTACSFHIYGHLKKTSEALFSHRMTVTAVVTWFMWQIQKFFTDGIRWLVHQSDHCLNARGHLFLS